VPLVSVLLSVHDDARFVRAAVESVLRQTVTDLELIVVDDASTDETPAILAAVEDPRLRLLRNERGLGLAASLNRGLDEARSRYVARLDADDIALPARLEAQLGRLQSASNVAVVGAAVLDLDEAGRVGALHRNPRGSPGVRWLALFGSPFFHPTVLVDREVLDRQGLRYDPAFLESEDYELWTRLLEHADGANLPEPLVLKRVHAGQASLRRGDLQESFQRQVALREIGRIAPELAPERAEQAWRLGSGRGGHGAGAPEAYVELLAAFERAESRVDPEVREAAARVLLRAKPLSGLALGPALPVRLALGRARRRREERLLRRRTSSSLKAAAGPGVPVRVTVVSPEPTPYRSPLFDLVAARREVELRVIYAARTVAGRTWSVEPRHPSSFLRGAAVPGLAGLVHHDYPVTPGIFRALRDSRPDVVVVSGWSTFAAQAAIVWCRRRGVPYVPLVESHDLGPRSAWRRTVKGAVVPRVLRGAAGALALGTAAREALVARGAPRERVRIFANTIDVRAWEERRRALGPRRSELRSELGAGNDDVVVLSVARLGTEKGLDTLVHGVADAGDPSLLLVLVGDGPLRGRIESLARELGVRIQLTGDLPGERTAEMYAAADVFALLSTRETWGVVVNEAAASGLPLVLSDRVGAAYDLLHDAENGFLVAAGDVPAAAAAFARLAGDPALRARAGERSRELVRAWGYEPSVEAFVAAVRDAAIR
jgi:glycosyltransferase involved in cell wall biosynthesis